MWSTFQLQNLNIPDSIIPLGRDIASPLNPMNQLSNLSLPPSSHPLAREHTNNSSTDQPLYGSLPVTTGMSSTLLATFKNSVFISSQQMEPSIGSVEGQILLNAMSDFPGRRVNELHHPNQSIYAVLVGDGKKCLLCDCFKSSFDRAVACIRTHLGHRPFMCGGASVDCEICTRKGR